MFVLARRQLCRICFLIAPTFPWLPQITLSGPARQVSYPLNHPTSPPTTPHSDI